VLAELSPISGTPFFAEIHLSPKDPASQARRIADLDRPQSSRPGVSISRAAAASPKRIAAGLDVLLPSKSVWNCPQATICDDLIGCTVFELPEIATSWRRPLVLRKKRRACWDGPRFSSGRRGRHRRSSGGTLPASANPSGGKFARASTWPRGALNSIVED